MLSSRADLSLLFSRFGRGSFASAGRGLIVGRWLEKAGERRRRCYRLTPAGRKFLQAQRSAWDEFVATINQIVRPSHA